MIFAPAWAAARASVRAFARLRALSAPGRLVSVLGRGGTGLGSGGARTAGQLHQGELHGLLESLGHAGDSACVEGRQGPEGGEDRIGF